ncbi:accessory gland [Brachionus plicatilis]|uniref:Accessory gland n=1 Tax=Brachionus plicatilis TaxID=10195 RepID=A0A3M7RRQ7_BRAPC|nr:accessory gland [Brachionus plicatilis]
MEDDFKNRPRGFSYGFGNFGPNVKFGFNENDDFFHSFFHHDFDQMFRDMENFMNSVNFPVMSNIGYIESPQIDEPDFGKTGHEKPENLRNMFLKPLEEDSTQAGIVGNKPQFQRSLYDNFFFEPSNVNYDQSEPPKDINKYFKRDSSHKDFDSSLKPVFTSPTVITSGQSCSIRRIQRPDGSIEEIKTVRNSDGIEEKTVTRMIGDKIHSVVEKKSNKGIDETEEIFQNFDKIDEFNKMWENFPTNKKYDENSNVNKNDSQTQPSGLISKLFSWFK